MEIKWGQTHTNSTSSYPIIKRVRNMRFGVSQGVARRMLQVFFFFFYVRRSNPLTQAPLRKNFIRLEKQVKRLRSYGGLYCVRFLLPHICGRGNYRHNHIYIFVYMYICTYQYGYRQRYIDCVVEAFLTCEMISLNPGKHVAVEQQQLNLFQLWFSD